MLRSILTLYKRTFNLFQEILGHRFSKPLQKMLRVMTWKYTYIHERDSFLGKACVAYCPDQEAPVCGTDGVTYLNKCQMKKKNCEKGLLVKVAKRGKCGKWITGLLCNENPYMRNSFIRNCRLTFLNSCTKTQESGAPNVFQILVSSHFRTKTC